MGAIEVPHFRYPLRLANGRIQIVEQDTLDDVVQCVQILLRTPFGWRPLSPEAGVRDQLWRDRFELDRTRAMLADQEPRADTTLTATDPSAEGEQTVTVQIDLAGA